PKWSERPLACVVLNPGESLTKDEVLDVVRELKGSGITMLIATHEMKFAQEISDRVCFLDGGRIAEQGQPQQLFTNPSDERTRQFLRRVNF
ncbi:MAG: hypothetical protein EBU22_03420, partial [Actinobacteria bacterium]|nr:hypothetical protein [Actinomycetota bacterium]